MESRKPRIARNLGKVEFLAHLEDVKLLFEKGYNKRNIHSQMVEKELFTMSYYTFCAQFRSYFKQKPENKTVVFAKPVDNAPKGAFQKPQDVDSGKLF